MVFLSLEIRLRSAYFVAQSLKCYIFQAELITSRSWIALIKLDWIGWSWRIFFVNIFLLNFMLNIFVFMYRALPHKYLFAHVFGIRKLLLCSLFRWSLSWLLVFVQEKLARGLTLIRKMRLFGWILRPLWSKRLHGLLISPCRCALWIILLPYHSAAMFSSSNLVLFLVLLLLPLPPPPLCEICFSIFCVRCCRLQSNTRISYSFVCWSLYMMSKHLIYLRYHGLICTHTAGLPTSCS